MKKTARKLTLSRSALMLLGALLAGQTVAAQVPCKGGREGDRRPESRRGIVPTIPVILDGVEYPAGALPPSRSGRTFVVPPEDQKNGVVHAFSSHEVAKEFMRLQALKSAPVGSSEALSNCTHPYFIPRSTRTAAEVDPTIFTWTSTPPRGSRQLLQPQLRRMEQHDLVGCRSVQRLHYRTVFVPKLRDE